MDTIFIKDLEICAKHGLYSEEREEKQKFLISLKLYLRLIGAGETGDLKKSIDYVELCKKVEEKFTTNFYNLLEEAGEDLAEFILSEYDFLNKVEVSIKKLHTLRPKNFKYVEVSVVRQWHRAYIALGSNVGNKEENLEKAIEFINSKYHTKIKKKSNFIITEAIIDRKTEEFLNGACEIKTLLSPRELINHLRDCEAKIKENKSDSKTIIDLDVLLYDDIVTNDEDIIIPHPRLEERDFVLTPLSEIAPYYVHPLSKKRIVDLRNELKKKNKQLF